MTRKQLSIHPSDLINSLVPEAVLEEVKYNFINSYPVEKFKLIRSAFKDFLQLYSGKFPGYRKCNVQYHNQGHITDTLLVFSRLVDGYNIENPKKLPIRKVQVGMIAALYHDSGYIQKRNDTSGTGAKYTLSHEKRSIEFIRSYFKKLGIVREGFQLGSNMMNCTDLKIKIKDIKFNSAAGKILSYMVGTADLVGQMADRKYLENLSYLYKEFKEAKIGKYRSEDDLFRMTIEFYEDIVKKRLRNEFENVYKFLRTHFRERYKINASLYIDAIESQLDYLKELIRTHENAYKEKLRRRT